MNVRVSHTNATCAVAYPIPLTPLTLFQAIKVGKAIDHFFFFFYICASPIICTKPLGLGLRAPCKVIIVLQPLTGDSSEFVHGLDMLSNMTSALNAAFECPAYTVVSLEFEYRPCLFWGTSYLRHRRSD